MITHISIRDFAIIKEADIDLPPGLSVITGETGAGKSIVIEAVSMALGSRAGSAMARAGAGRALIQIAAELPDGAGGVSETVLTREIGANGKSVARIDGEMVPLSRLSAFASGVADVHGQYEHQSLLKAENHLAIVDAFHSGSILPAKERFAAAWRGYSKAKAELEALLVSEAADRRRLDFMRYELDEIDRAAPLPGEDVDLRERIGVLRNSGLIFERLSEARAALCEGPAPALDALGAALRSLREISGYSKDLAEFCQSASDCYFALEDLAGRMRSSLEGLEFSPESLDGAMSRLDVLERLCSKYGGSVEKVIAHGERLRDELGAFENLGPRKAEAAARLEKLEAEALSLSRALSGLRRQAAAELEARIDAELAELNFSGARFAVSFRDGAEAGKGPALSENGADRVEFMISANRGQPLLPVARFASGGEMSRMMLAFKSVIGGCDRIPTMIFDEIDSGISGVTASVVGRKLAGMAEGRQIVCITHLPQIAALGDSHFMIVKSSDGDGTSATVVPVSGEGRVSEIARLIGGANVTEKTLASARELIALSAKK
ncbi:MAG: DNA repair protein RecN [Clostridiales Family XIII bacterium]|jgi:DNA repair protein RecN (Recombination protein N)|nr:DNA repair protein RecN [Clostridiales Family XIII bacterium]